MKILAVFPELVSRGGSERGLAYLAKHFKMDVLTNKYEPEKTFDEFKNISVIEWKLPNKLAFGLKLAKTKFSGYDIFLSYGYFITNFIAIKNHPVVWYCHTPHRGFHNPFRSMEIEKIKNPLKKSLKYLKAEIGAAIDKSIVKRIDVIVCNSENIRERVKKIYNRDAKVMFGPVDVDNFECKKPKNYYLYPGRIGEVKRTDTVVKAFANMPDKKLVIAGSATDKKYMNYLKSISGTNTTILENISDKEMKKLYSECIATICIPVMEDFGLVPVESMASGKPCIGANEGGLKETVVNGKTGFLITPTEHEIILAVNAMTPSLAKKMRHACEARAKLFSKEKFIKRMENIFEQTINKKI